MIKNILSSINYILFAIIILYFFCGGFKITVDYLIKNQGSAI
tara:strand:+ start:135 stop:260 length:126 start_codon:yes stop_codon:yes gene_type:complete